MPEFNTGMKWNYGGKRYCNQSEKLFRRAEAGGTRLLNRNITVFAWESQIGFFPY